MLFIHDIEKSIDNMFYEQGYLDKTSDYWSKMCGEEVVVTQPFDENEVLNDLVCFGSEIAMLRLFACYNGRNCNVEKTKDGKFKFTKYGQFYDKERWNGKPAKTVEELVENAKNRKGMTYMHKEGERNYLKSINLI